MRLGFILSIILAASNCAAEQPLLDTADDQSFTETVGCCDIDEAELELALFKNQALQSVGVSAGWMADIGDGGLSGSYLDTSIGTGIPLGSLDNLLGVKPRFRIDWIDAKPTIDIPSELYEFELQLLYRRVFSDRLTAIGIVSPSIRSDLTTSDHAFRMFALALCNWEWKPDRLTVSGGAVYLGWSGIPVLPVVGLTWTPNRASKLELRFPSSKLSYRLAKDGGRSEKWTYLTAGIGGNTWAVTRESNLPDQLSLRDFRLMWGIEKLVDGGGGWLAETGFAFARRLEYANDDTELDLGTGFLLTAGWRY